MRGMGIVYDSLGDFERALAHFIESLELSTRLGGPIAEARALNSIGLVYSRSGHPEEGLEYYCRAYEAHRRLGRSLEGAAALSNMGIDLKNLGRLEEAEACHREAYELLQAEELSRASVNRPKEAEARLALAELHKQRGDFEAGRRLEREVFDEAVRPQAQEPPADILP
nr:tetratricopeptide repeat protein [Calidithermus timidus]